VELQFVETSLKFICLHDKVNAVSVHVMYGECCVLLAGQDQRPLQRPGMGRSSGRRRPVWSWSGRAQHASVLYLGSHLRLPRHADGAQGGQGQVLAVRTECHGVHVRLHVQGKMWIDATAEEPGPGRLINHSKCHGNASDSRFDC